MIFNLEISLPILERTPAVLDTLLGDLSDEWTSRNDGPETWSPFDVVGHLIHGEKTDWLPRTLIILEQQADRVFDPYDRFAQFEESKGKSMSDLLQEFAVLRSRNITNLRSLNLTDKHLELKGTHPALGEVTLGNLLSTWVVHDLTHIAQITKVMARQYKDSVGPWIQYINTINY